MKQGFGGINQNRYFVSIYLFFDCSLKKQRNSRADLLSKEADLEDDSEANHSYVTLDFNSWLAFYFYYVYIYYYF